MDKPGLKQKRNSSGLKRLLFYFGIQLPASWDKAAYLSKKGLDRLSHLELATEAGTLCLKEYLEDLLYRRSRLLFITKELRSYIQQSYASQYRYLISVPGIGPVVATALLAEIGDFDRFKDPDQYCSFLGLMPWEYSSGATVRTKGIQPRSNKYLRLNL